MEKLYENSWAVLIGIGSFKSNAIPQLENPVNDVENMSKILAKCNYTSNNIRKLRNKEATSAKIKNVFDSDLSNKIGENDRLLVYYSGHGITRNPYGREEKKVGYLVPFDAKRSGRGPQYTSLIKFNELVDLVHNSTKARQTLFILDCCFGGIIKRELGDESEFDRGLCVKDMIIAAKEKKSVQIITAGGPNEVILDAGSDPNISILNDSIQKFVDGVNPNNYPAGFLSARNVARDVNVKVGKRSILLEKSQTPRFSVSLLDEYGEFVFKQFTNEEIENAEKIEVAYEPVEKIVLNSFLKEIFSRKVLLGCLDTVEQKCGKDYSLKQLRDEVLKIVKTNQSLKNGIEKISGKENLSGPQKKELEQYVRDNIVSIGLNRGTFNPKFILPDEPIEEMPETNSEERENE